MGDGHILSVTIDTMLNNTGLLLNNRLKTLHVNKVLQLIYNLGDGLGYGLGFRCHSCSCKLGLESESDFMQCENFCIVQCSHWVWSSNPSLNPSPNPAM